MGTIRLPYPHPGQIAVRQQAKRFNWLCAGRRWRKTTLLVAIAVEAAIKGARILWGAPTYDQVYIGWDETKHGVANNARFNIQRMTCQFPTGGKIVYRSLDNPDNARGHTADGIVIDEVGDVKEEAWAAVLSPMLADTGGWFWGIGTPRGRNWFYEEHFKAQNYSDSIAWQVPTLGVAIEDSNLVRKPHPLENPKFKFDEIYKEWAKRPEQYFRQEWLAEFVEDAGSVFRKVTKAATAEVSERIHPDQQIAFGVDWGKHLDFTVIVVVDIVTKQMLYMDRFNQIDYEIQRRRLQALAERYRPFTIIAEHNSMGDPIIEQLQREDLPVTPFVTTNASKAQIIDDLALAFEREQIEILNDPVLIGELQAYEMERLPSGKMRYQAPGNMHDDCVMALALAWSTVVGQVTEISVAEGTSGGDW